MTSLILPTVPMSYEDVIQFVMRTFGSRRSQTYLVGGCLRDLVLGIADVKDFDVCVTGVVDPPDLEGLEEHEFEKSNDGNKSAMPSHRFLFKRDENSPPIDVFLPEDPEVMIHEVIESFDLGFVRIASNGDDWILHPNFATDVCEKTIRVRGTGASTTESIEQRLDNFKERFPDWAIDDTLLATMREQEKLGTE